MAFWVVTPHSDVVGVSEDLAASIFRVEYRLSLHYSHSIFGNAWMNRHYSYATTEATKCVVTTGTPCSTARQTAA